MASCIANYRVQLNLPIYQGGLVNSQTREARDNYLKSTADMEVTERQTDASMRQTYNNIVALISKIQADKQSILSNESSVESTEAALSVGTRTMVDMLKAEELLYQAEQTLANDQYDYIIQTLTLKELAGILDVKDLAAINHWLTPIPQDEEFTDILKPKAPAQSKPDALKNPAVANKPNRRGIPM